MRKEKWNFYINILQGHPSIAKTLATAEGIKGIIGDRLSPGKILCIGCADGAEVKAFKELGYQAIGITLGQNNVDYGIKTYGLSKEELLVMDMHDLKFPPNTFDCVFSSHSFEHAFAPWIHIMEVCTVLKKEGKWWSQYPICNLEGGESEQPSHHHPNLCYLDIHLKILECCGFEVLWGDRVGGEYRWLAKKTLANLHSSMGQCLENRKNKNFE